MKSIDIFYKSYSKDFWLLYLSLKTITKNVTGYNNIVILIPESEKELFDTSDLPERTVVYYVEEKQPGWLWQQVCKTNAHKYCFAEFILFADSDCIWEHKIDLQEFVIDGKPEILYTDWSKVGDGIIWKAPTEIFMKEPVEWEFMRRNSLIYYRATLIAISEYAPDLEKMIMDSARFSEFNCIGAFAFKFEKHNYTFINTDNWKYVPPKSEQLWSHASKADGVSEVHLREYIRTLETIMKAYDVPLPE